MVTERFLYEIHPHRPIKNLIPGRSIIKPCSMKLTKEEVLTCMKSGPVFRAFPGKDLIRVTGSNLDQLHTDKFVGEKISTLEANYTPKAENVTRAQDPSPEEPKTEAHREEVLEENTESAETEEIPEELKNLVNNDKTMYEVTSDILVSSVTNKKATVSVQAEFPAGSSVEDVIRIKEEAAEELKEKSAEKMKELDTPDPEPEEEVKEEPTSVEEVEETTEDEEEVLEETEDEVEETTEVSATQNNTPHVNIHSSKKYYNNKKRH